MRKVCFVPALLLLMAGATAAQPAAAQKDSSGAAQKDSSDAARRQQGLSDQDKKFLDYVAKVNQAEIQLCLYAAKKAQSPAIKAFARLMVNDHGAVGKQLTSLVNGKHPSAHTRHMSAHARAQHAHVRAQHAQAPTHTPAHAPIGAEVPKGMSHEAEEMMSKFKDKSGAEFDSAFMAEQIDYHSQHVEKFDDEIKSTGNDGVRRFASETEDAFKGHLQMAKAVKESSGKP